VAKLMPFKVTVLVLSEEDTRILKDVINLHIMGQAEAKAASTVDPTLDTPETLLELMADVDHECSILRRIQEKL
jgi:hypothetical protein